MPVLSDIDLARYYAHIGAETVVRGSEIVTADLVIVTTAAGAEPAEYGRFRGDGLFERPGGVELTWPSESGTIALVSDITGGVTDHGALSGLADDDHTQYHTDARALAWAAANPTDIRDALGLGTGDSPSFTDLTLSSFATGRVLVTGAGGAVNVDADISWNGDTLTLLGSSASPLRIARTENSATSITYLIDNYNSNVPPLGAFAYTRFFDSDGDLANGGYHGFVKTAHAPTTVTTKFVLGTANAGAPADRLEIDASWATFAAGMGLKQGANEFDFPAGSGTLALTSDIPASYTDEQAQDAIGAMVSAQFTYTDGTPELKIADSVALITPGIGAATGTSLNLGAAALNGRLHVADADLADTAIFERSGMTSDAAFSAARILATKTTNMGDGFAAVLAFNIRDDAGVINPIGYIGAKRAGADNTGALTFLTTVAAVNAERMAMTSTALSPASSGGLALGTSSVLWGNVFATQADFTLSGTALARATGEVAMFTNRANTTDNAYIATNAGSDAGSLSGYRMYRGGTLNGAVLGYVNGLFITADTGLTGGIQMLSSTGAITFNDNDGDDMLTLEPLTGAGALVLNEATSTPANPTANAQAKIYVKGDNLIVQWLEGATIRYKYLTLSGTGSAWVYSATAP